MSIVVKISGKQYLVNHGDKFVVDRLKEDEESIIDIPVIIDTDSSQTSVKAKIIKHQKGKKIRVVKYRSKSNYLKQNGYRHYETILEILK